MVIRTSYDSTQIEQSGKDDSSVVVEKAVKSRRGSEGERKKISINISNLKLEAVKNIPFTMVATQCPGACFRVYELS